MKGVPTDPALESAAADGQDCRQPDRDSRGEAVMDGSPGGKYVRYNVHTWPCESDGNSAVILAGHRAGRENADRRTEKKKKRTVH